MATSTRELRDQVELFRLAEGFLASGVLFALVKLGVFERIGAGSSTAAALGAAVGAPPAALERLLAAGVAVGLLERSEPSAYRVRPELAAHLVPGEGSRLDRWFRFQAWWYDAFGRLDEAVRADAPSVDDYVGQLADRKELTLAMHDYASLRAGELARAVDAEGARSLLDVGCGPGTYAFELGARHPHLALHLADLPEVLEIAREVAAPYRLTNPVHWHPVDIVEGELPGRHDLVLASNVLHVLDAAKARLLVRRLFDVVAPGGSLVVHAQFPDVPGKSPRWPALVDLALLATTREGRNHPAEDVRSWMTEAGFTGVDLHPLSFLNPNSFLRGRRR